MSDMETSNLLPEFAGFGEHASGPSRIPALSRLRAVPLVSDAAMPALPGARRRVATRLPGAAKLVSFSRGSCTPSTARAPTDCPGVVALVRFADAPGVNLISNIVGSDKREPEIGRASSSRSSGSMSKGGRWSSSR